LNGIDAIRRIRADCPEVRVLCLSMHSERQFVAAAFEVGASGYLVKDEPFDEMVGGIRAVMGGRKYLSSGITGTVVDDYVSRLSEDQIPTATELTPREREVVQLVAEGATTKEIAARLNLSGKTVSTHREHIKKKLGIGTIAGLTKYALRHGLTTVDSRDRS
jgi:DNA-binding NarL/FixJ family response regulator